MSWNWFLLELGTEMMIICLQQSIALHSLLYKEQQILNGIVEIGMLCGEECVIGEREALHMHFAVGTNTMQ